ncbi:D-Ala-D-Ala carboxypeptidase family metallohydrolase [Schinkia azotoformans]|uniref:D-Ala-D-Ala carboxypeptidase family metallohydrolase n=1 Tax=Schinkia azotoformans TaxID=1454 RepID=UPI002E22A074|nr:D-Ala-D-Ala carboxypeptidase family metallohydrolase [Schinkia azotoformans]
MAIRAYSLVKDGNKNVSKNFKVREFACKDGSDKVVIDDALITIIQTVRDHFEKPVTITSAYRTKSHNQKVGGSPNSQHLLGKAADIKVAGVSPKEVFDFCNKTFSWAGIGLYNTFTHVDCRGAKITWDYRK